MILVEELKKEKGRMVSENTDKRQERKFAVEIEPLRRHMVSTEKRLDVYARKMAQPNKLVRLRHEDGIA